MSHQANEKFWAFSLELYARPGIADHCLQLQAHHQADVTRLLFACWYGATFGLLPTALLTETLRFSQAWAASTVKPLRSASQTMKSSIKALQAADLASSTHAEENLQTFHELRDQVKALELQAERHQHRILQDMALGAVPAEIDADTPATQRYRNILNNLRRTLPDASIRELRLLARASLCPGL